MVLKFFVQGPTGDPANCQDYAGDECADCDGGGGFLLVNSFGHVDGEAGKIYAYYECD